MKRPLSPDVRRAISKLYRQSAGTFRNRGLEQQDLEQEIAVRLASLPLDKGEGYRVRSAQNYLKDQLKAFSRHPQSFEREWKTFLNDRIDKGFTSGIPPGRGGWIYLLGRKDLQRLGYVRKLLIKPERCEIILDRKHPRHHKSYAFGRWLIGDLSENRTDGPVFMDRERAEKYLADLRRRRERGEPTGLPRNFIGDKRWVDDIAVPLRATDRR